MSIENIDIKFVSAFKDLSKALNAKYKIQKIPSENLLETIQEIQNQQLKRYENFNNFKILH